MIKKRETIKINFSLCIFIVSLIICVICSILKEINIQPKALTKATSFTTIDIIMTLGATIAILSVVCSAMANINKVLRYLYGIRIVSNIPKANTIWNIDREIVQPLFIKIEQRGHKLLLIAQDYDNYAFFDYVISVKKEQYELLANNCYNINTMQDIVKQYKLRLNKEEIPEYLLKHNQKLSSILISDF